MPMNINVIKGLAYNDEEFAKRKDKEGFERTEDTMDGCLKCPLLQYCQGAARKQTGNSPLLRDIDTVIQKINSANSHEWVLSQILSLQASTEGLVYPEFNPTVHIPGWDVMWQRLTGTQPLHDVSRERFIKELKRREATFIAGIDWGYTNPATCVVCAIDKNDNVYVIEATGRVRYDDPEWVEVIKTQINPRYDIQMFLPDSENPSGISLLRKADLPVAEIDKGPGSVKFGINVVKGKLRIPGTNARTQIFFAPDIKPTSTDVPGILEEFTLYSKEIDAAGVVQDGKYRKEHDHYLDALRYALYFYFGKSSLKAAFANSNDDQRKTPDLHTPKGLELAAMAGVHINDNRGDHPDAFAKPDTLEDEMGIKDDDDDPDDDPEGGGGGLMVAWT